MEHRGRLYRENGGDMEKEVDEGSRKVRITTNRQA